MTIESEENWREQTRIAEKREEYEEFNEFM
jgi:hypothetical protein